MKIKKYFLFAIVIVIYACPTTKPEIENTEIEPPIAVKQENRIEACESQEDCKWKWAKGNNICLCDNANQNTCNWICYSSDCEEVSGTFKQKCEDKLIEEWTTALNSPVTFGGQSPVGHEFRWIFTDQVTRKIKTYSLKDNVLIQSNRIYTIQLIPYVKIRNTYYRMNQKQEKKILANLSYTIPLQPNVKIEAINKTRFNIEASKNFDGKISVKPQSARFQKGLNIYNFDQIPKKLKRKDVQLAPEFPMQTVRLNDKGQISSSQLQQLKLPKVNVPKN